MPKKLVVVGLDGATYQYLDPLIEQGKLPTLARLVEGGTRGLLESARPPISCPAWFCYSTGCNPGKLGIYGWRNFDPKTRMDHFNDYKQLTTPEVWDHLGQAGLRSAVLNIPTMFPPKAINGYMVSGMQAEEHQTYTHPPSLKEELKEALDYRVGPKYKMLWDYQEAYEEIVELFELRFKAALHLLDRVDLLHVTIFHIDEVQHNAWNHPDLEKAWVRLDQLLGEFLEALPEDIDLLFMSDHGFVERSRKFFINTWLEEEGYLHTHQNQTGEALRKLGVNRQRLERVLRRFGLLNVAKALVPESMQRMVKEEDGSTSNQRRLAEIDWDRTRAFASTNFTLHVLEPGLTDEIAEKLRDLKTPEGEVLFEEVLRADDEVHGEPVLHGDKMDEAPQLLYVPTDGQGVGDGLGRPLWELHEPTAGGHHMQGILLAHGPAFKEGGSVQGARLIDLAPTILHYFGLPVPESIDGRVLEEAFVDPGKVTYTDAVTEVGTFSDQELDKVEDRLRGLGYLE